MKVQKLFLVSTETSAGQWDLQNSDSFLDTTEALETTPIGARTTAWSTSISQQVGDRGVTVH